MTDDFAHALPDLIGTVSLAKAEVERQDDVRREPGDRACTAGNGYVCAGGNDARAFDDALVDGVTQGHICERTESANVPDGGKSRGERGAGVWNAAERDLLAAQL